MFTHFTAMMLIPGDKIYLYKQPVEGVSTLSVFSGSVHSFQTLADKYPVEAHREFT